MPIPETKSWWVIQPQRSSWVRYYVYAWSADEAVTKIEALGDEYNVRQLTWSLLEKFMGYTVPLMKKPSGVVTDNLTFEYRHYKNVIVLDEK